MRSRLSLLLFLICAEPAFGQQFIVAHGIGRQSCGSFVAAVYGEAPGQGHHLEYEGRKWHDEGRLYAEWIQGYITAINILAAQNGAKQITVDYPGIELWMRNWCQANPTKLLMEGLMTFVKS
jgi:hypothetical protein